MLFWGPFRGGLVGRVWFIMWLENPIAVPTTLEHPTFLCSRTFWDHQKDVWKMWDQLLEKVTWILSNIKICHMIWNISTGQISKKRGRQGNFLLTEKRHRLSSKTRKHRLKEEGGRLGEGNSPTCTPEFNPHPLTTLVSYFSRNVVSVDGFLLQEHVKTALILGQRVTCNSAEVCTQKEGKDVWLPPY